MTDERADAIKDNAAAPAKSSGDGFSAEQHPIPDQIAADKYARGAGATQKTKPLGIRLVKRIPPGAV